MSAIVCDLGGTNCRFGVVAGDTHGLVYCQSFRNDDYKNFSAVLSSFLRASGLTMVTDVVIALAAPVTGNRIVLTNRPWVIDKEEISEVSKASHVHFLNDFQALAFSLARVENLRVKGVLAGKSISTHSPRLVVGAGTGFNSAIYLNSGEVVCAETGHSTLVTETDLDFQLQRSISKRFGRCSQERVLSGSGIIEIYSLLCQNNNTTMALSNSQEIVDAGIIQADSHATQACREFIRILARSVGDLALQSLPFSGIYLSGGITRALSPLMCEDNGEFRRHFTEKGRMKEEMKGFPVSVLSDDNVALYGCLEYLFRLSAE